jgi:hypothetical protein
VEIELSGGVQARFSYGRLAPSDDGEGEGENVDRLGFGVRRARFRSLATIGSNAGVFLQLAGGGTLGVLDAYGFYQPSDHWRLRFGRMATAQPRASRLTSFTRIDAIARPEIVDKWVSGTIGAGGRDFGLDAIYTSDRGEAILAVHNGDGSWNRQRGNYRPDVNNALDGTERLGMAASLYGAYEPEALQGVEVGGYVGYNGSGNPNTAAFGEGRMYLSYAAHAYWGAAPGSQPLRLKADLIGVDYEVLEDAIGPEEDFDQRTMGLSLLGAGRVHQAGEVFARLELYDPNNSIFDFDDQERYVTVGGSFSLSALRGQPYRRQRLTLAYTGLLPEAEGRANQHLVVLQAQLIF